MFLLAVAAFPPACFSSFIAANSFKTTLPKVNPVHFGRDRHGGEHYPGGHGRCVASAIGGLPDHRRLLRSDLRRDDGGLPAQRQEWSGPRAGFNPAGWVAWAAGLRGRHPAEPRRQRPSRARCSRSLSARWCISSARRSGCSHRWCPSPARWRKRPSNLRNRCLRTRPCPSGPRRVLFMRLVPERRQRP